MSWTQERVELLKKLWSEGLSASQIAAKLGGISRNAVIGKVHRLHLSSRGKGVPVSQTRKPLGKAPTRPNTKSEEDICAPQVEVPAEVVESFDTPVKEPPLLKPQENTPTQAEENEPPKSRNLSLLELTESTCKWPLGDPLAQDFHFCGIAADDNSPYCSYHSKIAFQVVSSRRRKAG